MFDLIIANPPYDGNLFLKITEKCLPITKEMVMLGPVRWLQDPTAKYSEKTDFAKFKSIRDALQNITVIEKRKASDLFHARFETDIGVYELGKEKRFDENTLSFNPVVEKVSQKIISQELECLKAKIESFKLKGFRVRVPTLRGDTGVDSLIQTIGYNFYYLHFLLSMVYKDGYTEDGKKWSENRVKLTGPAKDFSEGIPTSISFNSLEEAKNFEKSTKTNFYRYIFNKLKTGKSIPNNFLPFMEDYSQEWNDERFYKHFGITESEQKEIYKYLKENKVPNIFGEETEGVLWKN